MNRIALFLGLVFATLLASGCRESPTLKRIVGERGRTVAMIVANNALIARDTLNHWPAPTDSAAWARVIQFTGERNFDWTSLQRADTLGLEVRDREYKACFSVRIIPDSSTGESVSYARGPHKCGQALAIAPSVIQL